MTENSSGSSPVSLILICVDQMQSFSLGCNGNPDIQTPNLDALAADGVSFRRAYCNNPMCMPSRATILTGLTPRQHGLLTNGCRLPTEVPTLPQVLLEVGYRTHSVGKLHLQPFGAKPPGEAHSQECSSWESRVGWDDGEIESLPSPYYGFESADFIGGHIHYQFGHYRRWLEAHYPEYLEAYAKVRSPVDFRYPDAWKLPISGDLHYNHWIVDRSISFLQDHFQVEPERPFFLWCSFPDPHHPFAAAEPYNDLYNPASLSLNRAHRSPLEPFLPGDGVAAPDRFSSFVAADRSEEETLADITAQTYGMITHIDAEVGRLVRHLKDEGRYETSAIVFLADHGEYLGSHDLTHKHYPPFEEVVRVPFIWKPPGGSGFAKGRHVDVPVSLIDFVPTVLEFARAENERMDMRGNYNATPEGLSGASLIPLMSANMEKDRLKRRPVLIEYDDDKYPGLRVRVRTLVQGFYKLSIYGHNGFRVLNDLDRDPEETTNFVDDPEYREVCEHLMQLLAQEMIRSDRLDARRLCGA